MCTSCSSNPEEAAEATEEVRASLRVRHFHLILADIAVAAAVQGCGHSKLVLDAAYVPGAIRDLWQEVAPDDSSLRRVNSLANAGVGALQGQGSDAILNAATRYGVPLNADLAGEIASHFAERRDAVLTYDH
jgi:hypothetical protein